jgi:large subunit ribosomal protein L9
MKVILNKDIPNLGEEGEIKDVARGYARNFLIPQNLVMPYSRDTLSILESRREKLEERRTEKRKLALDVKTRLETEDLVIEMPAGDRGRLFGSVTSANIVDALAAQGISIERKRIDIPEKTIKSVGTTRVRVRLYEDEEATLKVVVKATGGKEEAAKADVPAAAEAPAAPAADAGQPDAADAAETVAEQTPVADAGELETEPAPAEEETQADD